MLSTARGAQHNLRAKRFEQVRPGWLQDVLQSIRWMHGEHVKDLRELGYSPKEAFWLNFACLPFLPWDQAAGPELRLSTILGLYADLHRSTVGPVEPADSQAFLNLLKQRYRTIRQQVAATQEATASSESVHESAAPDSPAGPNGDPPRWMLAGLIVMRTAREWRQHRSTFPCRLVEDI